MEKFCKNVEKSQPIDIEPAIFELENTNKEDQDNQDDEDDQFSFLYSGDNLTFYFRIGRLLERFANSCNRQLGLYRRMSDYCDTESFSYHRKLLIATRGDLLLLMSQLANGPPQNEDVVQQETSRIQEIIHKCGKVLACIIDDIFDVYVDEHECMN